MATTILSVRKDGNKTIYRVRGDNKPEKPSGKAILPILSPCPWRGQPIEDDLVTVDVTCGCKANRTKERKLFIVHDCALKGRCLPAYTCTPEGIETTPDGSWAEPCKFCPSNPANQS